ncbi:hypothetical protein NMY22_g8157 [Coprinellus aureogranulatus]|nr:hypothetical protein NMY22_g8157 [Coprinellus aureogranulatus]
MWSAKSNGTLRGLYGLYPTSAFPSKLWSLGSTTDDSLSCTVPVKFCLVSKKHELRGFEMRFPRLRTELREVETLDPTAAVSFLEPEGTGCYEVRAPAAQGLDDPRRFPRAREPLGDTHATRIG